VRCVVLGKAVLANAKTEAGEDVIVDAAEGKVESVGGCGGRVSDGHAVR
jgi:hypothetical protein